MISVASWKTPDIERRIPTRTLFKMMNVLLELPIDALVIRFQLQLQYEA